MTAAWSPSGTVVPPIPQPVVGTAPIGLADVQAVHLPESPPGGLARLRRRIPFRKILCLLPLLLVTVVAVRHHSVLAEGFAHLRTAQWPWLLAATAATCLTWVAAACIRQGAAVERLPTRRLLATQFAASTANHLLPTGLGAGAVNLRFMRMCGLPLARSSAALALHLLAEAVGRLAMLGALLLAFPKRCGSAPYCPTGHWGPF
ncbi:putative integral membrane protein [Streptomyces viridochromogenes Tue57]|uniref:Putative integral membrane protein n=1 Tax=Streptomyces viridochromogenes Tue57 TaxID=1160705 RepID=L8P6C8_STRVR|nr:putative integral membrane protein [Streptomyces viridochromogenes Tue57]